MLNSSDYHSPGYKRSRKAYAAQCTFEYFVALLVADALLAKLLSSIGIQDALVGIISSFISLAFVVQIFSIALVRLNVSRKRLIIVLDTISQLFFCSIYFLPFLDLSVEAKTILVTVGILVAYVSKYLISSICFQWANSFVAPSGRAVYSAKKEIISLATGILFSAGVGYVIDHHEGIGNLNGGFLFIACSILILNVCNFVSLILIEKDKPEQEKSVPFSQVLANTMGNRSFRNILVMTCLWECARFFSFGFLGIYKTKDLLLSVFAVQLINIFSNIVRMLVSQRFGRYSDKNSFAKGMELALTIAAAGSACLVLTIPQTKYLIILYTVLYSASLAGSNQNSFNIIYSYVDSRYFSQALAIKSSIGGLMGFLASLAGGRVLSLVQENGNRFLGSRSTDSSYWGSYPFCSP